MARFGRSDRFGEEEEDYGYEDQPYYEDPAPEPPSYDPGADAAVEALTGGGDSLYDPGPGPALDALFGNPDDGMPYRDRVEGAEPPEPSFLGELPDGPMERPNFGAPEGGLDLSFMNPPEPGRWRTMGAGRNDQYDLPDEYNILDPGAIGGSQNDPNQATLGPSLPDATGVPGQSKLPDPNAPPRDPNAPRITTPDDPTRGMNYGDLWQSLFGVPYGQFPPGYGNPMGLSGVGGTIGASTTPSGAGAAGPNGPGTGGATGANTLEGFNLSRAQNPTVSAKDAFAAVAQAAPRAPDASKEASEAWFNQNIKANFEKYGHKVNWVKGDQMNFTSPEGTFTVDFHRGAGAPGSALWWGVQGGANPGSAAGPGSAGMSGAAGAAAGGMGAGGALGGGGYAGNDAQGAFQSLKSSVSPNAPKEEMEAAITAHFRNVPGFSEAYKESVKLNGVWYDMVISYGGPGATWAGSLSPKT